MEIHRVTYGNSDLPESWIVPGGDENKKIPIIFSVFLIETAQGYILVDTGSETMPGFEVENFRSPVAVLREMGVMPQQITHVIITHAHHDHIACVNYFPKAKICIQQEEYEIGKEYLSKNENIILFSDEMDVLDGIKILKIGGHTIGSCVVECQKDGRTYVLCGDECYSFYNLRYGIPTASSYDSEKSKKFIETYGTDRYTCLLCHEK